MLLTECDEKEKNMFLLDDKKVTPRLKHGVEEKTESNMWYLDNGASNHMTGVRSKFVELDENVTGSKVWRRINCNNKGKGVCDS